MFRVLQQEWINGRSCLVEEEQRDALLEFLNSPTDIEHGKGEEEVMPDYSVEEVLEEKEEGTLAAISEEAPPEEEEAITLEEPSIEIEGEETEPEIEEIVLEDHEEEILVEPEEEEEFVYVTTWYYSPNGSLTQGF